MKIEIKNIKINNSFSEETICFIADVYVNGKKTAYAKNDGHGGATWYNSYENMRDTLSKAEEFAKSLPSTTETFGGKTITLESNLERMIDDVVYDFFNAKEIAKAEKKKEKLMESHIVFGVPNSDRYSYIGFNGKPKLSDVAKTPMGKLAIENMVKRVKLQLKDGQVIFNKNLFV
jgi:hypothetical protein